MSAYDKLVYVGCDAAQSGTFQGELILDTENKGDINGDGKVSYIMIQGDPENIDAQLRTEYSVKALTDAGVEVEQLDLQRGDWDRNKGQEIAQNDLAPWRRSKSSSATTMIWLLALWLSSLLAAPSPGGHLPRWCRRSDAARTKLLTAT